MKLILGIRMYFRIYISTQSGKIDVYISFVSEGGFIMCGQYTLELQSPEIQHLCKKDKRLARVISAIGPLTYSLHQDAYSFLIREIIEQMMSVKAASVIYGRLVDLCSGNVTPDTISSLTDDQSRSTGTSKAKVEYIRNVTRAVKQGIRTYL